MIDHNNRHGAGRLGAMDTLGQALYAERARRGHSQSDAAAIIGVRQQSYSWWERNRSLPRMEHLPALASYLRMPVAKVQRWMSPSPTSVLNPTDLSERVEQLTKMVLDLADRVRDLERRR